VAAFYRAHPDPDDIHSDLPRHNHRYCETCGQSFSFNDYAKRGGQREPKFCSSKCRQKAYRDRNGVSENRDYRTRGNPPPNQQPPPRANSQPPPRANQQPPPRSNPPPPRPGKTWADALRFFNLGRDFDQDELRKAYRETMKRVHPDVNKASDATEQAQYANWAWNYLRRH
jgi:hypothetical protein